jgi:hypothetical protein
MQQITAYSNPHPSFSLSFYPLCIRRGFDKNFARSCAEHSPDRAPVGCAAIPAARFSATASNGSSRSPEGCSVSSGSSTSG